MPNLRIDTDISASLQRVEDEAGNASALGVSSGRILVGGELSIENAGDGLVVLRLGTERAWVLKQTGTGAATALELTAANPNNNNKNFLINTDGRVGVGTTAPEGKLHVTGGQVVVSNGGDGNPVLTLGTDRAWVFRQRGSGAGTRLELTAANPNNNNKDFVINTDGGVGIGRVGNPEAKLHVEGSVRVTDDVVLTGADCAEEFEVVDPTDIGPGSVLVMDDDGRLRLSDVAYDPRVAGVVSGAGDVRPGVVLGRRRPRPGERRAPVALTGTVQCLVDAGEHPVQVGDLLTTSPRPGHAMKAVDRSRAFGAVLGKAMGRLTGVGLAPVLVSLQ